MDKIKDALKILDESAKENKELLIKAMTGKYDYLKNAIADEKGFRESLTHVTNKAVGLVKNVKKSSTEKAKAIVVSVDQSVRKNPWHYIGGVAAGSLLIGYILSRKKAN